MAKGQDKSVELIVALQGRDHDEEAPKLAFHAIARDGEILSSMNAGDGETIKLTDAAMSADAVVVLSAEIEPDEAALKDGYRLSPAQLAHAAKVSGKLELSPSRWRPLLPLGICVDGSVRKCWWWPLYKKAFKARVAKASAMAESIANAKPASVLGASVTSSLFPGSLKVRQCRSVCEGTVEVYERTCCCWPVIIPPVIVDISDKLRGLLERLPEIRIPPRPQPDPIPFKKAGMFISGTLDEQALNAEGDLAFLESAPFAEAKAYVEARPYLMRMICTCSAKKYRGYAIIGPDGEFSMCYRGNPLLPNNCHREYSFRVRQKVDGINKVIYDGVAAGIWFDAGDDITLTSYDPDAIECPGIDLPIPTDTPFAMLERIGAYEAWEFKTPVPTAWDSAQPVDYNDGLAEPATSQALAVGKLLDRNFGGVLALRYLFTPSLKAQDATYYRVRVCKADPDGEPTGPIEYMDGPITWKYWETVGGDIKIRAKTLNLETNPSFYEIPYIQDKNWLSKYSHVHVDTREWGDGRHLVTLELYDSNLKRLAPNNALDAAGTDKKKPFTYEWWHDPLVLTDPENTQNVPYAGLTHLFWWDNQDCVAEITKLRNTGVANDAQCQFMSGTKASTFGTDFKAYHPYSPGDTFNVSFMWKWELNYWKGLGGAQASLDKGSSVENPGISATKTFAEMLGDDMKCTFSLELYVHTKTTNGSDDLDYLDQRDVASFALDRTP